MAAIAGGLAADWRSALSVPADVALALLDAGIDATEPPAAEPQAADRKPPADGGMRWRENPDGSRSASFGSIDGLRAFLKRGGEMPGVRLGQPSGEA